MRSSLIPPLPDSTPTPSPPAYTWPTAPGAATHFPPSLGTKSDSRITLGRVAGQSSPLRGPTFSVKRRASTVTQGLGPRNATSTTHALCSQSCLRSQAPWPGEQAGSELSLVWG